MIFNRPIVKKPWRCWDGTSSSPEECPEEPRFGGQPQWRSTTVAPYGEGPDADVSATAASRLSTRTGRSVIFLAIVAALYFISKKT